jgi:F-type H+-transporting ATPase subunit a
MIFDYSIVKPFEIFGLTGSFWNVHTHIIMATWIAMGVFFALVLLMRCCMGPELGVVSVGVEKGIKFFVSLIKDSFGYFNYTYFAFVTSLFLFALMGCLVGLLPYVEEATKDINTTFALALTSFLFVQYHKIRVHGFLGFLKEFIQPLFVLAPIHVVGELSKVASMSFRFFGNILGGSVILSMAIDLVAHYKNIFFIVAASILLFKLMVKIMGLESKYPVAHSLANFFMGVLFILTWAQIVLGIFEGLIQSFVLTMLTTTYLAMGTAHEQDEHKETA